MTGSQNEDNLGANRRLIYQLLVKAAFVGKVLVFLPAILALSGGQEGTRQSVLY